MTHFTILWLGSVISSAVYALVSLLPGSAVLGNIFFDTEIQALPAIYRNATSYMTFSSDAVDVNTRFNQSGALVPIYGNLTFSEVNGFASGALAIENPTTDEILCDALYFDVTRNHLTAGNQIKLDVYAGTGSINEITSPARGTKTGSTLIQNNWTTSTGSYSLGTGSVLAPHGPLKLYGNTDTTQVNQINVVSIAQSGSVNTGFTGTYHLNCWRLE